MESEGKRRQADGEGVCVGTDGDEGCMISLLRKWNCSLYGDEKPPSCSCSVLEHLNTNK